MLGEPNKKLDGNHCSTNDIASLKYLSKLIGVAREMGRGNKHGTLEARVPIRRV